MLTELGDPELERGRLVTLIPSHLRMVYRAVVGSIGKIIVSALKWDQSQLCGTIGSRDTSKTRRLNCSDMAKTNHHLPFGKKNVI